MSERMDSVVTLLGWLAGIFILIIGLTALSDSIIGGSAIIIGALLIIPPSGGFIAHKTSLSKQPRYILAILIILVGVIIASTATSSGGDDMATMNHDDRAAGEDINMQINELLKESDSLTIEALGAINSDEFDLARKKSLEAKSKLEELQTIASQTELSPDDRNDLQTFIEYEQRWSTIVYKTANLQELTLSVAQRLDKGAELRDVLPELELVERASREDAANWREFADYVSSIKEFREKHGITDEDVQVLYGLANDSEAFAEELATRIDDLKREDPAYTPVAERPIEPVYLPGPQPPQLITEELARFFDSFDTDGNEKLSIGEAQEFYYWVENNIVYRYDDEGETKPIVGTLVGDGRDGTDYRQTPQETFEERAGDCEDMATLEQAFYRYYGIDAYVAGVESEDPDVLDHATTIVRIADNLDFFREALGGLIYYKIPEGARDIYGNPMNPGVYMLVDNAYSDVLGYVSGGRIAPGTFRVHCTIPLEQGYTDWNNVVRRCGVPMD